jgi:hypothetical protein
MIYNEEQILDMIAKQYVNYGIFVSKSNTADKYKMSEEEHKQFWLDHIENNNEKQREFYLSRLEWSSAPIDEINKRWFHFGA